MKTVRNMPHKNERGFTLIEIAIVLVIIGLLLGGVLQGQQLIENSRVKSAVNSFNGIAAATFSYQDRYGRLPGDDPGAVVGRGASWDVGAAGNGNGVVLAPIATAFAPVTEAVYFFQNLRSAGFIAGDPTLVGTAALPQNPFGGLMAIVTEQTHTSLNGTKVCMGNVPGTSAIALDTQLDDGNIDTGRLRGSDDAGVPNAVPGALIEGTPYTEDASYTVCYRI